MHLMPQMHSFDFEQLSKEVKEGISEIPTEYTRLDEEKSHHFSVTNFVLFLIIILLVAFYIYFKKFRKLDKPEITMEISEPIRSEGNIESESSNVPILPSRLPRPPNAALLLTAIFLVMCPTI